MEGTNPIRNVSTTPIVHARDHQREQESKPFSLEAEEKEEPETERHADEPIGPKGEDEAGGRLDIRA